MAEEKKEIIFDDGKISESHEFVKHIRTSSENPESPTLSIR